MSGGITSLAFKLFAIDEASPVFERVAAAAEASGAVVTRTGSAHAAAMAKVNKFANAGAAAAVLIAGASIKMAADFQEGLTTLVTGAGEAEHNLKAVGDGIKKIAVDTGTSTEQLTSGMFMIESAGFHGAAGLDVLEKAAMGAKVGNADLGAVADAVTTLMKDYASENVTATQATNGLVAAVSQGKTHMEDLAPALSAIAPAAASAHIGMDEMLGAMATLTSRGIPASKAATALRATILKLESPSAAASKSFARLGLSTSEVGAEMRKSGLVATLDDIIDRMSRQMGPSGALFAVALKKSAESSTGFQATLDKANPKQREWVAELANMMGGVKSLQAGLVLASSSGLEDFKDKTEKVAEATGKGKKGIEGWAEVQKDLNFKLDKMKQSIQTALITLGEKFIPILSKVFDKIQPILPQLIAFAGALLALAVVIKVAQMMMIFVTAAKMLYTAFIALRSGWMLLNIAFAGTPLGWIVIGIGVLIVAIVLIATKTTWFQTAWKYTWNAIKVAAQATWAALKVVFDALVKVFLYLGGVAVRFYQTFIYPTFRGFADVAHWLYDHAIKPVFDAIVIAFKKVADAAGWLWANVLKPVINFISAAFQFMWAHVIKPVIDFIVLYFKTWAGIVHWVYDTAVKPVFDLIAKATRFLYDVIFKPIIDLIVGAFQKMASFAHWLYDTAIKPVWDLITSTTGKLKDAMISTFDQIKNGIKKVWDGIKKVVAEPINFVIDAVYNHGIVALWNKIAHVVGLDSLKLDTVKAIKFATGGPIPGNVPGAQAGRDSVLIHAMPDEHMLTVADVQAMGGHDAVYKFRKALHGGAGVNQASPGQTMYADGGPIFNPAPSVGGQDTTGGNPKSPKKGGGGIFGTGIGPDVGPDLVPDGIIGNVISKVGELVRGAMGAVVKIPLDALKSAIKKSIGQGTGWKKIVSGIATKPIDWIEQFVAQDDAAHQGGANVAAALSWAKTQVGKPYQWGGGGDPSWDCSGFMAAIQKVILGQDPHGRLWSTFDFVGGSAPQGWEHNLDAPFKIGITNEGVGHTAGTLAGTNVECRGGDGVVVGAGARGFDNPMFTDHYGFKPSIGGGPGGAAPPGTVRDWIVAGLSLVGQGSNTNWINALYAIAMTESSGNPNAINLTDSNAQAGHPSKGLLQFIDSTFMTYAVPGHTNIWSPIDQAAADWGYINAAYGGDPWLAASLSAGGGYKSGGLPPMFGTSVVGEDGPELLHNGRVIPLPRSLGRQLQTGLGGGRGGWWGPSGDEGDRDLGTVTLCIKGEDGRTMETKLLKLKHSRGGRKLQFEEK